MYEIERNRLHKTVEEFFGTHAIPAIMKTTAVEGVMEMVQEAVPNRTAEVVAELSKLGILLCGGAITSLFSGAAIKDLDFYVVEAYNQGAAKEFFAKWFPREPYTSSNAVTYKRKSARSNKIWTVQLITRFMGPPAEIFRNFDFTVTMGAFDFGKNLFELHDRFLPDIAKRRLVYSGASLYPICAMARIKKYEAKGYTCPNSTVMHIALCIVQLKIENYAQLKQQLFGIDTIYLQKLLAGKKYQGYVANNVPVNYGEFIEEVFIGINGPIEEAEVFEDV